MKYMVSRLQPTPHRVMPVCCCLILALLLVACGGGTTSTPTPTPPPQPSPTPSPTPTPGLTVYTGKGYSISYPQGWKVTPISFGVSFTDATGVYNLAIVVSPNPNGITTASTVANKSIEEGKKRMKNPQTETLPPTTTVGGESWVQQSISGTETINGQSVDAQVVLMSDNHPAHAANTQNFTIAYGTAKSVFATATTSYFQPMLNSFKFT
jgi:hypothetical protein